MEMIKKYQTLVLQSIVEYLHTGNEDVMVTFKGVVFSGSLHEAVRCAYMYMIPYLVIVRSFANIE